jgi:RimJ/RimL family protein N-acetyltransferase
VSASRFTERLVLRQWRDEDLEPFAALNADAEVMRYFPAALDREQSDAMVSRMRDLIQAQGWGLWAVERRDTGALVGFTGLSVPRHPLPFQPCVEVGWRLARGAWGRGFATEAAREALRVGFHELGLTQVVSFTAVSNVRSRAVMERLGMTRDPTADFDHPALPVGHPLRRHVLYRISADRFAAPPGGPLRSRGRPGRVRR